MPDTTNGVTVAEIAAAGAIAGSLVTTVLGFVTTTIKDLRDQHEKRRDLIREKLEDFTHALTEARSWVNALLKCRSLEEARECGEPEMGQKLEAIALLYFEEMINEAQSYSFTLDSFYWTAVHTLQKRPNAANLAFMALRAELSWIVDIPEADHEKLLNDRAREEHSLRQAILRRAKRWHENRYLPTLKLVADFLASSVPLELFAWKFGKVSRQKETAGKHVDRSQGDG